jgi:hypothetical protein
MTTRDELLALADYVVRLQALVDQLLDKLPEPMLRHIVNNLARRPTLAEFEAAKERAKIQFRDFLTQAHGASIPEQVVEECLAAAMRRADAVRRGGAAPRVVP